MRRLAAVAALLLLAGCDDDTEPSEPSTETTAADPAPIAPGSERSTSDPAARERAVPEPAIVQLEHGGPVTVNGSEPPADAVLRPGDRVATGEGGRAVLSARPSTRIELGPETVARLDWTAPLSVVVARGRVRAILPPAGNDAREPLRLGTPEASVEIGGSGDAVVAVAEDGATWAAVLSGRAEVTQGALGDEDRPVERALGPGQAFRIAGELPVAPEGGPTRLEDVDQAARAALAREPARSEGLAAALAERAAEVDALHSALEAEGRRGESLAASHRAAAASPERARSIQRDIVRHSQRVLRLRAGLRTRWERLVASVEALRAAGRAPDPDPAAERSEAVRRALGDAVP